MENILIDIYQQVHLLNGKKVEVFVNQKELHLMVQCRILDRGQYDVQHFFINVCLQIQVQGVNEDTDFE